MSGSPEMLLSFSPEMLLASYRAIVEKLSPSQFQEWQRLLIREVHCTTSAGENIDDVMMLDLSTAASFLGIPLERAARVLPVVELGPRTRRVRIADYKAYVAKHTRQPAAAR